MWWCRIRAKTWPLARCAAFNASLGQCLLELSIEPLFKQAMAAHHAGLWVGGQIGCRKPPEPRPTFSSSRVFSIKRMRQEYAALPAGAVLAPERHRNGHPRHHVGSPLVRSDFARRPDHHEVRKPNSQGHDNRQRARLIERLHKPPHGKRRGNSRISPAFLFF